MEIQRLRVTPRPGLYHLNLSAAFTSYPSRVEKRKQQLSDAKRQENPVVFTVAELLENSMYYHLPRRKSDVQHRYEKLYKKNPKHLNTLAELKSIYNEVKEFEKSEKIADEIRTILDSDEDADVQRKCVCLLEQAYAMLFEERTDTECSAYTKICDAYKILSSKEPELHQTEIFKKTLTCTDEARKLASQIYVNANDENLKLEPCIKNFTQGIDMLSKTNYPSHGITVWGFYLAMALNRIPEMITNQPDTRLVDETSKAINLFWSTICDLPDDTDEYVFYRARSYVYIGQIMACKGRTIDRNENTVYSYKYNPEFQSLDERSAIQRALVLLPKDEVVLNRAGRTYWHLSKQEHSDRKQLEDLQKAEQYLSLSIQLKPRIHLRTFSTRMLVYENLSRLHNYLSYDTRKELLLKARSDGLYCMEGNLTLYNVTQLAGICTKLAKFPDFREGPNYVSEREFLQEAVDYLNLGRRSNDVNNYNYFSFVMSLCLFDLGEFRGAIEWGKCAFFQNIHNEKNLSKGFQKLCNYMLTHFAQSSKIEKQDLLDELFSVFEEMYGMTGGSIDKIRDNVDRIAKYHINSMRSFLFHLSRLRLTKDQADIAMILKSVISEKKPSDRQLQKLTFVSDQRQKDGDVKQEPLEQAVDYPVTDVGEISTPLSDASHNCVYDFLIVHGENEGRWIKCFLLHQLEEKMHDDDIALQGHLSGRDDELTNTAGIRSIIEAFNESRSILLVLTNQFLCDTWPKVRITVTRLLVKRPNCIIVVFRDNCDVPSELSNIKCVSLVERGRIPDEIRNLKLMLIA